MVTLEWFLKMQCPETLWKFCICTRQKKITVNQNISICVSFFLQCMFLPRLERSLLAQLRLGILPLKIETGRFVNLPLVNRTCTLCDMIVLEDEVHFVKRCPLYEIYRNQLFQSAKQLDTNFNTLEGEQKLSFFLNSLPKALLKFLKLAWNRWQNELYNFYWYFDLFTVCTNLAVSYCYQHYEEKWLINPYGLGTFVLLLFMKLLHCMLCHYNKRYTYN